MRVYVTGGRGFVGRWLTQELASRGHEVSGVDQRVDVTDATALRRALSDARPDAIAHLAGVSFAPDAADDPLNAFRVNMGGTLNLLEVVRQDRSSTAVLVAGSSDVYRAPDEGDLPLTESSTLEPQTPYALSKAAAESVALSHAARYQLGVVVTRSFNHMGPGQRQVFVVPAIAHRVQAVALGMAREIPVGNADVRRDLTDVRDVVRAYRLILEHLNSGALGRGGMVFNVAHGVSIAVREIARELAVLAGIDAPLRTDPDLARQGDPAHILGDSSNLSAATGWRPEISMSQTFADVWRSIGAGRQSEQA